MKKKIESKRKRKGEKRVKAGRRGGKAKYKERGMEEEGNGR